MLDFLCPVCGPSLAEERAQEGVVCQAGHRFPSSSGVTDPTGFPVDDEATVAHFTKQWGAALGMTDFLKKDAAATAITPGKQLGWPDLIGRILSQANERPTLFYDLACGFGGVFADLFAEPMPAHLYHVGADIHQSLGEIGQPVELDAERARFVRWDISAPLPTASGFDYVICRAAIQHTSDPERISRSLVARLKEGV